MATILTATFIIAAALAAASLTYSARELAGHWPMIRRALLTLEA